MASQANATLIDIVRRQSTAARVNAAGLVLTSAGMLMQIAAGSTLYPSITGPIVLIVAAILVIFGPGRAAPWVGLVVPLVLGVGAIVASAMTGGLIDQLTDIGRPGVFVGSLMHVIGLTTAIAAGLAMFLKPGRTAEGER